jgi:hypothetical protein
MIKEYQCNSDELEIISNRIKKSLKVFNSKHSTNYELVTKLDNIGNVTITAVNNEK